MRSTLHRTPATAPHPIRLRVWLLGGATALLAAIVAVVGISTLAWGATLRDEGRLLPGTTIAGVDVGGSTVEEARAAVDARLSVRLDGVVTVSTDDGGRWEATARDLGAATDVDEVLAAALERTVRAGFAELTRLRLLGATVGIDLDVTIVPPDGATAGFVDGIGDDVDRSARDATITWDGAAFEVGPHRPGRRIDRDALIAAVEQAIGGGEQTIELDVQMLEPAITDEMARTTVGIAAAAIDDALDRTITVEIADATSTLTPRTLGATPDADAVLEAATQAGGSPLTAADVPLDVDDAELARFVGMVADDVEVAVKDATIAWSSGNLEVTSERAGRTLDRDTAAIAVRTAVADGHDRVELEVATVSPAVTRASFDRTLVLNQAQRRLYYYVDGEAERSWPVAVGQGGSPTPTGVFAVGARRYEPTWNNPAPNGWGANMPARIGPGPDNPLGARALNWNRDGQDTLIRFHGTPNEASIGQAASQGCVRMYNKDVIELYDLIPSGTTIVSVAG